MVASSAICVTLILLILTVAVAHSTQFDREAKLPRHNSDAGTELLQSGAEALQVTSG